MRIVIASGKGGTGKTLVATNMAFSLVSKGIQLLDCDVEEPNDHLFLPFENPLTEHVTALVPEIINVRCSGCGLCATRCMYNALSVVKGKVMLFSDLCHSCGGCIIYCPLQAIEQGEKAIGRIKMGSSQGIDLIAGILNIKSVQAPELIKEVLQKANVKTTVLVDAPPGTSCSAVAAGSGADFCLLVTEPTPYGLHDLKLAVAMTQKLGVPIGVIINKSDSNLSRTEQYCLQHNLPILLQIPYDLKIAKVYAEGGLISRELPGYQQSFRDVLGDIERMIDNA